MPAAELNSLQRLAGEAMARVLRRKHPGVDFRPVPTGARSASGASDARSLVDEDDLDTAGDRGVGGASDEDIGDH